MQMSSLGRLSIRRVLLSVVFPATLMGSGLSIAAGDAQLQSGASYRIVRQVYLMAVYESMDERRAGKGAAVAYLQPEQYAKTRWVAFQCEVPAGTTMKIIGPAPPARDLLRSYDAYYVQLAPDPSRKLDVIVQLFKGFASASGGLSAEFFERID
jgi:hypothetical protein